MIAYVLDKKDLRIKDVLEFDEYAFKEDIDYNDKSTVKFIKQPNLEDGDFVYCKDSNTTVFFGICEKIKSESAEVDYTVILLQKENLFNRFIFADDLDLITEKGIGEYLKITIDRNFINSQDSLLDFKWLDVHSTDTTKEVSKPDIEQGVFNLKTYLGNLKQHHGIFTELKFNPDGIDVIIQKRNSSELMVDMEVSDVSDYIENYDISVLAKLNVKWKKTEESAEEVRKSFFLLSDRTISEDVDSPQRVEGSIKSVSIITEKEEDMRQQVFNEFASNRYNHKITFNIVRNSKLYPEQNFYIGRPCMIKTKSGVRKSMITKKEISSNSALLKITLGNMKVTLTDKLRR